MSPPPMRIAVQDANVLIDLELAGLFDLWFQTGIETHTTDFIRAELKHLLSLDRFFPKADCHARLLKWQGT